MRKGNRSFNVFTLSFLDIMFCGFGAVILLVMIINHDIVIKREHVSRDLRGEVALLEKLVLDSTKELAVLRNTLEQTLAEQVEAQGEAERIISELETLEAGVQAMSAISSARRDHVNSLKSDLETMEQEKRRLQEMAREAGEGEGEKIRTVVGSGDRQYLTGLKVGGKRIAVLVDASASMLDDTIVNVIRRRNLPDADKRASPKWRRALDTVDWVVSQIPPSSQFQILIFNTTARPLLSGTESSWLDAGDARRVNAALDGLRNVVPEKGTSLYHAFAALAQLSPRADNVYLITDGLPTQGKKKPWASTVKPRKRFEYFQEAVRDLPTGVPFNVILLAMEGDPEAASAFWKLAGYTQGSFLSPSKDWP
jgi:hypothetical protein